MSRKRSGKRRAKGHDRARRRGASGGSAPRREWVGGRVPMPGYVRGEEPFRPELILWLELPDDLVVGQRVVDPRDPAHDAGTTLLAAMRAPGAGAPRRPDWVRVASATLAAEVRAAVPGLEVVVAPTPELDPLFGDLIEHLAARAGGEPSYLDLGDAGKTDLEILFHAAARLYPLAPWQLLEEEEVLRVDIPSLGLEAGCLTAFGRLGESTGIAVFPSLVAFERFLSSTRACLERGEEATPGAAFWSLQYLRGAELPETMRREVAERGWPVAGAHAYPLPTCCDAAGNQRPMDARDLQVLEACAGAVAAFCEQHRDRLAHRDGAGYGIHRDGGRGAAPEPLACTREVGGIRVHLSLPYDTRAEPAIAAPAAAGDGPDPVARARALHELDRRLVDELFAFATERWAAALRACVDEIEGSDHHGQLFPHVALHDLDLVRDRAGKTSVSKRYLSMHDSRLSRPEREWLGAQQRAWLSTWAVTEVHPDHGLELEDRLSGERREVIDVSASRMLLPGHVLLGRVVDQAGLSLLCGSHPRPLPPGDAYEVERRIRAQCRRRRGPIALGTLREPRLIRWLCSAWEQAVEAHDERRSTLPALHNTDGEPLLLTAEHFSFDPARHGAVAARLDALDGFEAIDAGDGSRRYDVTLPGNPLHASWGSTLVGRALLERDRLRLESNSAARADRLRARVEAACEGLLRHRAREHADPVPGLRHAPDAPAQGGDETPPPELAELVRAEKARHYATWPDTPLPALGGKTPREALRSGSGRERIEVLLRELRLLESREPEATRFDVQALRAQLGLDGEAP